VTLRFDRPLFAVLAAVAYLLVASACGSKPEAHDDHDDHDHAAHGGEAHEGEAHADEGHADEGEAHEGEAHADEGHADEGEAHEDRVTLPPETLASAGVVVETAGPRQLDLTLDLPGEVVPNADRLAHIVPRFPGIAKQVGKSLGDHVEQGEVLATLESNESLSPYEVRSLIAGTVIEKHITLGEFVRDDSDIYVVADLSTVWVQISVYSRDLPRVRTGAQVEISATGGEPSASGRIDYIAPALGEATRAASARVVLSNSSRVWRPGMFVTARVVEEQTADVIAVRKGAIQRFEGREVVFVQEDGAFEPRPVELGRADGQWTEILSGLASGDRYAARGGFILKSELMKSEAGHDH